MAAVIQFAGILDEQILSGLAAARARLFPMRSLDLLRTHLGLVEKPIGGFEVFHPRKYLRQGAARTLSQPGADTHQTLGEALVSQFGQRKFGLRPLGGR